MGCMSGTWETREVTAALDDDDDDDDDDLHVCNPKIRCVYRPNCEQDPSSILSSILSQCLPCYKGPSLVVQTTAMPIIICRNLTQLPPHCLCCGPAHQQICAALLGADELPPAAGCCECTCPSVQAGAFLTVECTFIHFAGIDSEEDDGNASLLTTTLHT